MPLHFVQLSHNNNIIDVLAKYCIRTCAYGINTELANHVSTCMVEMNKETKLVTITKTCPLV